MGHASTTNHQMRGLSGSTLKWIAMTTMIIDHIGAAILLPLLNGGMLASFDHSLIYSTYLIFRLIGRIAFPIFCFLLVEGFTHTSNIQKYALRLGGFAILSEIPFNLAFTQSYFSFDHQNVFFTLLLGLIAIWGISKIESKWLQIIPPLIAALAAELLHTDYGSFGVILISVIYIYREKRLWQSILAGVMVSWELTAPISFVLTYYYNDRRGRYNAKWLYWIYPIHLLVFGLIATYL